VLYIHQSIRDDGWDPVRLCQARHRAFLFRLAGGRQLALAPQMALALLGPCPPRDAVSGDRSAPTLRLLSTAPGSWANHCERLSCLSLRSKLRGPLDAALPGSAGGTNAPGSSRSSANARAQSQPDDVQITWRRPAVYEPLKSTGAAGRGQQGWSQHWGRSPAEGELVLCVGASRRPEAPGR